MFNKILFNRNAYDRHVSLDTLSIPLNGSSQIQTRLIFRVPVPDSSFKGVGSMTAKPIMQQIMPMNFSGQGDISPITLRLGMRMINIKFSGLGALDPNLTFKTPFRGMIFEGQGTIAMSNRMYLTQQMVGNLSGSGSMNTDIIFSTNVEPVQLAGSGKLQSDIALLLPMELSLSGSGSFNLRRLAGLNENVLELLGINLAPGEIVTIDTDLLQVWIGSKEDVDSVTKSSVFFELNPGENEIKVSTDTEETLDVTAVWQNRWF